MRRHRRISSYRKLYLTVLLLSLGAFLLPGRFTGRLISLVQVLVPFQHAVTSVVGLGGEVNADRQAGYADPDSLPPVSGAEHAALQRERDALEHQIAAIASRVRQLESEVEILTATRLWDVGGRGIGPVGKLIPAQVVTKDLLAWRESRLVTVGSLQGIKPGAPVVSNHFSIDHGRDGGVRQGMAILLKETLIGVAEKVGTHTTRVKLLSDLSVQMKVRIGRFEKEEFVLLDPYYWLTGRGKGIMRIGDVNLRDVEDGKIRVGDMIFSDPMSDTLPAALTIGRIARIDHDVESPLLSTLTVESPINFSQLRRVYVFDPDKGS